MNQNSHIEAEDGYDSKNDNQCFQNNSRHISDAWSVLFVLFNSPRSVKSQ